MQAPPSLVKLATLAEVLPYMQDRVECVGVVRNEGLEREANDHVVKVGKRTAPIS